VDKILLGKLFLLGQIASVVLIFIILFKMSREEKKQSKLIQNKETQGALKKNEEFFALERENKELSTKVKDLEAQIAQIKRDAELVSKEIVAIPQGEALRTPTQFELEIEKKRKKIGEIFVENKYITGDILNKALEYQQQRGGTITQYLLGYGYIDEADLVKCMTNQFGIPYLPLSSYNVSEEMLKMVPVDIAQKNWLIPVDKLGGSLMVVMADPLNTEAIRKIEELTKLNVMPFVGVFSEIVIALQNYYKINVDKEGAAKTIRTLPFLIDVESFQGLDRRNSIRFNSKIDILFPAQGFYKQSQTKDVSRDGFSFLTDVPVPVGSIITLEVLLPKEIMPLPIAVIAQAVRTIPREDGKFEIDVKTLKVSKDELDTVIEYASSHQEQ